MTYYHLLSEFILLLQSLYSNLDLIANSGLKLTIQPIYFVGVNPTHFLGLFLSTLFEGLIYALSLVVKTFGQAITFTSQIFTIGYPTYHSLVALVWAVFLYLEAKEIIIHEIIILVYSAPFYSWFRDFYLKYAFPIGAFHYLGTWFLAFRVLFVCVSLGSTDPALFYEIWNFMGSFFVLRHCVVCVSSEEILTYEENQRALEDRLGYAHQDVLRAEAAIASRHFL